MELSEPSQEKHKIIIECKTCHKNYYYRQEHKHLEHDIIEAGTTCPHCEVWHRIAYFNADLIERQKVLRNNRQRRAFRRDLGLFQAEAMGLLGMVEVEVEMGGKIISTGDAGDPMSLRGQGNGPA